MSTPDVARKIFNWVLETDGERLSSKSYNRMLGILGVNGLVEEFWGLVDVMKKKGYEVSGAVRDRVALTFEKEGLESDLEKLRRVFASGLTDNSVEKVCSRMCKIIKNQLWGDDVEERLLDLNRGLVKHDERSYNAMARSLGKEDFIDRFWKVVDEMRSFGYEMEMETFTMCFEHFCKRKMIKEAIDLYEFSMAGSHKTTMSCSTFLLKKLVEHRFDASGNLKSKITFSLASTGKKEEAVEFIDRVEASNTNLDPKAWVSLIEGCCAAGDLETSSTHLKNMVEKEGASHAGYAFEWLVYSDRSRKSAMDACRLLHKYFSLSRQPLFQLRSTRRSTSDRRAETTIVFVVERGTKPLKAFVVNRRRSSLISVGSIVGNNSISIGFSSIHDDPSIRLRHIPHHHVPCIVLSLPVSSLVSVDGGA
ncbi:Myosin-H heavy chain isoform 1 [Hibiscus syriacus]|uniref:Myosin-H heavy chain isoform 1 n=1 Tax=Hibiscus syriacus TaxID=106335 RepID=A0A6A3A9Q2_HIBSY|nr:Myosin-H heavy chain isoform 1 [Hibiscus syriacus]